MGSSLSSLHPARRTNTSVSCRAQKEWKEEPVFPSIASPALVENVLPTKTVAEQESQFGILNKTNPTQCCQLRKVEPLMSSLEPFQIWFTGLRREQSPTRANLKKVEQHRLPSGKTLLKVSLLADWKWSQVWEYTGANKLSYLPQYDEGYASIGCEPCTAIPEAGSDPRSGRWGGKKLECGIHTFSQRSK